jgi:hypothetical protein
MSLSSPKESPPKRFYHLPRATSPRQNINIFEARVISIGNVPKDEMELFGPSKSL